jgi:protein-tyrosine phosphatase
VSDPNRAVRTSRSHPIRVDWLNAPGAWRIGITIAPGKRTVAREGFRWERELGADLDQLVVERVHTLVCLLEPDEMLRLGIPDLVTAARARGIDVIHAPIVDVSVPSSQQAEEVVSALLTREGLPLVIHCNGGLGRSGVIAGCLLRALGLSADGVLARLRAARGPECPQTKDQRAFVASYPDRVGA